MKKLAFGLILLFCLSGCQLVNKQTIKTSADYKQGYEGLKMRFVEKPSITEIYEKSPLSLNVILENKGAYDIENGRIIIGFEDQNFKFVSSDFTDFRLEGRSVYYPKGNQKLNTFQIESKEIREKESIERETHLYITACTDYRTEFSENICIDSDIYGLQKEKPCTPKKISLPGGQGAPVVVKDIETRMIFKSQENSIQPQFTLYLDNRGGGRIINKNNLYSFCSSQPIENEDINTISLEAEIFSLNGDIDLECKPENPIKMKKDVTKVVCTSPELLSLDVGTYTSPIHITIDYGYMTTISKEIKIKKLST